jgi:hypothetical protein
LKSKIDYFLYLFAFYNPLFKSYNFPCEDGTTRLVYKKVEDAHPIPKEYTLSANVSPMITDFNGNSASLNAQWQERIRPLISSLSDKNVNYILNLQSVYSIYQRNPCLHDEYSIREQEKIRENEYGMARFKDALRLLIVSVKENPNDPENMKLFRDICDSMRVINPNCINQKLQEAQELGKKWIGGQNAS